MPRQNILKYIERPKAVEISANTTVKGEQPVPQLKGNDCLADQNMRQDR